MFFSIPYIPYSIRNCPEFRGITQNPYGICWIPRNFVEFHDFWCHGSPHNFILLVSFIVKTVSWHFFSFKGPGSPQKFLDLTPWCQIDSPLHHAGVRFDSPLHHAAVRFDSLLHHAAVRVDSPLQNAAVRSDSPLQDAAGSHNATMQWEDLTPRCIMKNEAARFASLLHNAVEKFDSPLHHAVGIRTSILITPRIWN